MYLDSLNLKFKEKQKKYTFRQFRLFIGQTRDRPFLVTHVWLLLHLLSLFVIVIKRFLLRSLSVFFKRRYYKLQLKPKGCITDKQNL